jgi:hypothetical protein
MLIVAILSIQRSGISPKSASNPVWGTRNGTDIIIADMMDRPHSIIFSFFIKITASTLGQRYK